MDRRVAGGDRGVLDPHVATLEIGHYPARLADEQHARGDVPGRELLLPEPVEPTRGHVRQIERGGARPTNAAGERGDAGELPLVFSEPGDVLEWKPRPDE